MNTQFLELRIFSRMCKVSLALVVFVCVSGSVSGQEQSNAAAPSPASSLDDRLRKLQEQLAQMQTAMTEMRDEISRSRAESTELRSEMEATRLLLAAESKSSSSSKQYSPVEPHPNTSQSAAAPASRSYSSFSTSRTSAMAGWRASARCWPARVSRSPDEGRRPSPLPLGAGYPPTVRARGTR